MAEDLYKNADPGRCVICGQPDKTNLCTKHHKQYRHPVSGLLPFWLVSLRHEQSGRMNTERFGIQEVPAGLVPRATTERQ